ncbi:MAG: non-ribosomal peptide synthetase, partial [bacterium]|nr:non-ribosomal peptide synthetase [bacterium]
VLEDAGYGGKNPAHNETGVYVGYSDDVKLNYFQMVSQLEPASIPMAIAGNLSSIVPTRISYFMDLKGPGLLVDTACSSALVAIHLACQALLNGDCQQAIAGGVRINLVPIAHTAKVGIESSDGRTRTFDDDSDGAGTGEGAGAVLLKPLDAAIRDRDNIYAVIKGSAINQDGQSLGITAPSAEAQTKVSEKEKKNAGIDPETISYIEAHGTGTRVGDPIEVEAITGAFKQFTNKKQFCGIGSVKTNIGHTFEASGIFGFIKSVLALKNRVLPPLLHFNRPNRNISFEESPVYINDELRKWNTNGFPLRCGVTAFGFSGTNCHVILEEAPSVEPREPGNSDGTYLLPLSAKSPDSLRGLVQRYRDFLEADEDTPLVDICYTAAVGRSHYDHRLVVIGSNRKEILKNLDKSFSGVQGAVFQPRGTGSLLTDDLNGAENREANSNSLSAYSSSMQWSPLAVGDEEGIIQKYIQGETIDWEGFYKGIEAKRVPLPLYPFERHRCWIDIPAFEDHTGQPMEGKLFFDMEWIEEELQLMDNSQEEDGKDISPGVTIVINDDVGIGPQISRMLQQNGRNVLSVTIGSSFMQE